MGIFSFLTSGRKFRRGLRRDLEEHFRNVHRHLDFLHGDIFGLLNNFLPLDHERSIELVTDHPVAYKSDDHLFPVGTVADYTRCPKFFWKCESFFPDKAQLRFLDLGCSGGGLVLDALLRGHFAIGLEGSDHSIKEQRAAWRIAPNNLFTCDVTKEFKLQSRATKERQQFDIISMWDVLEHIPEDDLPQLLKNIHSHLADKDGLFVGSISMDSSFVGDTGVDLHVTKKPKAWWDVFFSRHGFESLSPLDPQFMPRGAYNPPQCYQRPRELKDHNFGIAVRKI